MLVAQVWAFGGSLLSMWLTGARNIWGPAVSAIGFIPWATIAILTHQPLMLVYSGIVTVLQLRAVYLWKKRT